MIGKFLSGRLWQSDALHELAVASFPPAGLSPGANRLGDDGTVYTSERWPTDEDDYVWVSVAQKLEAGVVPQFFEPGFAVTVGTTGADYPTLTAAFSDLLLYRNKNVLGVPPASLTIKAGYVVEEQVELFGADLSWVLLTSEDDWVEVDAASFSPDNGRFMLFRNSRAPVFDCGFERVGVYPGVGVPTGLASNASTIQTLLTSAVAAKPRGVKNWGSGCIFTTNSDVRVTDFLSIDNAGIGAQVVAGSYASFDGACRIYGATGSVLVGSVSRAIMQGIDVKQADNVARATDLVVGSGGIAIPGSIAQASFSQPPNIWNRNGVILSGSFPSIYGEPFTIADDAVATITPPRLGGVLAITVMNGTAVLPAHSGLMGYACGSLVAGAKVAMTGFAGSLDTTIVDLTGTTGTNGNVTVSVRSNDIQIENRAGGSRTFALSWM